MTEPHATLLHLGFCEPISDLNSVAHRSADWNAWDGGQVGGRPSWLQPKDLPLEPLTCRCCATPLTFICQLYAPGDGSAFHRSLYIFACPRPECVPQTEGSVRVLRVQLPMDNPFYPEESESESESVSRHLPENHGVSLCAVCGQRGKGKCPLQGMYFCGKYHQREYKTYSNKPWLPSCFSMHELVVEDEPQQSEQEREDRQALFESTENDDDSDEDLEQGDLNAMTGATKTTTEDVTTTDFYARIQNAKEQCLRYSKWKENSELWIRSDSMPSIIPDCRCGATRRFECQIMPQMLHYLLQDRTSQQQTPSKLAKEALMAAASIVEQAQSVPPMLKQRQDEQLGKIQANLLKSELDWGTICIYTCTESCDYIDLDEDLGAYHEEYAWKQPPLE